MSSPVPTKWIVGGGALLFVLWRYFSQTSETEDSVGGDGTTFNARLTGYWPKQAGLSAAERLMEGKDVNSRSGALYTLEDYQRGGAPYVSVSGDDAIFPWGQLIHIDAYPGVPFRVVDTGGNFRGLKKVYRVFGREPLDICVDSSSTVLTRNVVVSIVAGDDMRKASDRTPATVNYGGFAGQDVG